MLDIESPVSTSPAESLTKYDVTLKSEDAIKSPTLFPTQFDPTLGLRGLLKYPQPTAVATLTIDLMPVSPPEYRVMNHQWWYTHTSTRGELVKLNLLQ